MNKFPEVRMRDVVAVLSCQNDEERVLVLKKIVMRSLTDYYSAAIGMKLFILAVDPVTSAQVAGQRCFLVKQRVHENFSLWWNVPSLPSETLQKYYEYFQERKEKIQEYKMLLEMFHWYHFMIRSRIKSAMAEVENEPISLRNFLRVCFYQYQGLNSLT